MYKDLREWIKKVDQIGELSQVDGVSWDLEASAVISLTPNIVLFDHIPGYPPGYRIVASFMKDTLNRFFITANWSTTYRSGVGLTRAWLEHIRSFKPVPPKLVDAGPIAENIQTGDQVDIFKFPVPHRHVGETGRYIGTGDMVILKDPETGRINCGTYRLQAHNKNTTGIHSSEGKDGRIIMEKYKAMGKPCPVVALVGVDPGSFYASTEHLVHDVPGVSELEVIGWLKRQPEEVMPGRYTGLPIPVNAEIALEGEIPPDITMKEGRFAEWTGYCMIRDFPVIQVKAVYHRNEPILSAILGEEFHPSIGMRLDFKTSAFIWDQMEKAGVRGIKGVASYNVRRLIVVAIKNLYAGHSQQAAHIASQCHSGAYGNTYVIVVDDNVDPTNIQEVLWQVVMRTDPKRAIQLTDYCWASHLAMQDPSRVQAADYAVRMEKATYNSKAIIDACVPLEWDPNWHGEIRIDPQIRQKMLEKYGKQIPVTQPKAISQVEPPFLGATYR